MPEITEARLAEIERDTKPWHSVGMRGAEVLALVAAARREAGLREAVREARILVVATQDFLQDVTIDGRVFDPVVIVAKIDKALAAKGTP